MKPEHPTPPPEFPSWDNVWAEFQSRGVMMRQMHARISALEAAVADRDEAIRVLAKDLYNCINGLPRQDSYIAVVADEIADVALAEASSETTGENA